MKNKINKTNAARLLDQAKITYNLIPYEVDENNLAATHVAEQLGEPIEQVFKTLVLRSDKNDIIVCVIPGNQEINLKKAAKTTGNKHVEMIHVKELQQITGYIRGGCSPIGMKKNFPVFIQESCLNYTSIFISAGIRGMQIEIAPQDLIRFTNATVADLI